LHSSYLTAQMLTVEQLDAMSEIIDACENIPKSFASDLVRLAIKSGNSSRTANRLIEKIKGAIWYLLTSSAAQFYVDFE